MLISILPRFPNKDKQKCGYYFIKYRSIIVILVKAPNLLIVVNNAIFHSVNFIQNEPRGA